MTTCLCFLWTSSERRAEATGSAVLNQVRYIHGHLLDCGVVKRLDVSEDPFVFLGDKVNGDAFPAEAATAPDSAENG